MRYYALKSIRKNISNGNYVAKFFVLLGSIVIILYCFSTGISGNDFWWHVKVGEFIAQKGVVPKTDIFSWMRFETTIPWTAHEWLAELIFYEIHANFGDVGIFILSIGLAFFLYYLLWHKAKAELENNILVGGLFFGLFAVLTSVFFYGRPHIFGFILLFFELDILYAFYEGKKQNRIWLIPVIAILWSNLHGGSSCLSYIICILFGFVGCIQFELGRLESKRLRKKELSILGIVTLCTMGAIFINPIGSRAFLYPYENMGDALSMYVISEWQAPDIKKLGHLILYFFPIVIMSLGLIIGKEKVRLLDFMVMGFFVFLFLRSARFSILWYISAPFYAFRYMPVCPIKDIRKKSEIATVICTGIVLVGFGIYSIIIFCETVNNDSVISKVVDDEIIQVIKTDNPERIFNDYNFGETLIYHDIPVFFDARADLFSKNGMLADGIKIMMLRDVTSDDEVEKDYKIESWLGKYQFDAFFIPKDRPLYIYLNSHPELYEKAYEDGEACYFKREVGYD